MRFIKDDFLLDGEWSGKLYAYAEKMPIIDYHCHLSPKEICEDRRFENISELWLGSDHYKWRLMRSAGIKERYVTGDASPKEKFLAWAKVLPSAIGNPLLEWSHMELKRLIGFEGMLDEKNAEEVYEAANEKLKHCSARQLIRDFNVEALCTTDDPIDDLRYHQLMSEEDMGFRVYPAWRPDRIINIDKKGWQAYLQKLEEAAGIGIRSYADLLRALSIRLDHFARLGCRIADQGLARVPFSAYTEEEIEAIFRKALEGKTLTADETEKYQTSVLRDLSEEYTQRNWVSQLHYGVKRDNRSLLYERMGADAGADSIGERSGIGKLADLLELMDKDGILPKTVIYSLHPDDNTAIDTVIASFQRGPVRSYLQHGSAWWFNDNYDGMLEQLRSLAAQGCLACFVGMLTDSRSFLSYVRHDYFRRVLCHFLGELVEQGRYPEDEEKLKKIVEDISYNNAKEYFGFDR